MSRLPLRFAEPVTLVGAGPLSPARLAAAQALAPHLIAADGAADVLAALGHTPAAVVGDMDSLADPAGWAAHLGEAFLHLAEQDTTDFEKCRYAVSAPWYLAVGFSGGRIDHQLAVLHALMARPAPPVILLGETEAAALIPPGGPLALDVPLNSRVSLFPLAETTGTVSEGLAWPVAGLTMAPGRQIGTSNRASGGRIAVGFDRPGALLMLDPAALPTLIAALTGSEGRAATPCPQ